MRRAGHSTIDSPAPVGRGHGFLTAALAVALIAVGALGTVTAPLAQGKSQAQGREAKTARASDAVAIAVGNVIGRDGRYFMNTMRFPCHRSSGTPSARTAPSGFALASSENSSE